MKIEITGVYNNQIYCTLIYNDGKRINTIGEGIKKYIDEARRLGEQIDFTGVEKIAEEFKGLLKLLKIK